MLMLLAGVGLWLVIMGGRTADVSWFLTRTDAFLNDVVILDRWCHFFGRKTYLNV